MKFSDVESVDDIFRVVEFDKPGSIIIGELLIRNEQRELYDKFSLKLDFNSKVKHNFPKVSEIGLSIPWVADRHVNRDGTFCLALPHEESFLCKQGISFSEFIHKVLYIYLVNQSLINNGKAETFLMGEHAHNEQGIVEHYQKLFPGFSNKQIIPIVNFTMHHLISRTSKHLCPCDSNSLMINCHFRELAEMKSYGKKRLAIDLINLFKSAI